MKAVILAAGKSKRMRSRTPKVLHTILNRVMLLYITDACAEAGIEDVTVIISPDGAAVRENLPASVNCVTQPEPLGTGHAVMAAREVILPDDDVLVLCGDMPLVTAAFLTELMRYQNAHNADAVVTSVRMAEPYGYGRVFADDNNVFIKITEQTDLAPEFEAVSDINTGVYIFKGGALLYGLDKLDNKNKQNEYYLSDVPAILQKAGRSVIVYRAKEEPAALMGVNTQEQLADAARIMRGRINRRHMANGVRMLDPDTAFIDNGVDIAPDVILYPNVILEGKTRIARGAVIGPNTRVKNSAIGENTTVQYSVVTDASVGSDTDIGPFAYLRPGADIGDNARVGDFVEVKNARLGNHSKASHLAYIGDADVGDNVNFGCGAITANYDGKHKHRTVIGDGVFVGSNSTMVAPVTLNDNAFVAAGSTITDEVPADALAIARQRQENKQGWRLKRKF